MLIKGQEDLSTSCTQSNKSPQPERIVQFDRHVISEDDVSIHRELGRGRFSHVDHGVWSNEGSKVGVNFVGLYLDTEIAKNAVIGCD